MTLSHREALQKLRDLVIETLDIPDDQLYHPEIIEAIAKTFAHLAQEFSKQKDTK